MTWRTIIKEIFSASFLTIILPATAVSSVVMYFGLNIQSLLAIIFLGQFYIIWAQLEVALRQTRLSTLEYEPEFVIEIVKKSSNDIDKEMQDTIIGYRIKKHIGNIYCAKLKNLSTNLALNVSISADANWKDFESYRMLPVCNIKPHGAVDVCLFVEDAFNSGRSRIEVRYKTILGQSGRITFRKDSELTEFEVSKLVRMPGILLSSFEKFSEIINGRKLYFMYSK